MKINANGAKPIPNKCANWSVTLMNTTIAPSAMLDIVTMRRPPNLSNHRPAVVRKNDDETVPNR